MILSQGQFPVVVQAYDLTNEKEIFIAEQLVSNQSEVDVFVNKYAGKLIKARALTAAEGNTTEKTVESTHHTKSKSSAGTVVLVILIILSILIAIGFYTGWIQQTFGISL